MNVATRVQGLSLRPISARVARRDSGELTEADVEIVSHSKWKGWVRTLDEQDRRLLRIWRGGATGTPTRRYSCRRDQSTEDPRAACNWCSQARGISEAFLARVPSICYNEEGI